MFFRMADANRNPWVRMRSKMSCSSAWGMWRFGHQEQGVKHGKQSPQVWTKCGNYFGAFCLTSFVFFRYRNNMWNMKLQENGFTLWSIGHMILANIGLIWNGFYCAKCRNSEMFLWSWNWMNPSVGAFHQQKWDLWNNRIGVSWQLHTTRSNQKSCLFNLSFLDLHNIQMYSKIFTSFYFCTFASWWSTRFKTFTVFER